MIHCPLHRSKVLRVETAGVKLDKDKGHSLVRLCILVPAVVHSLKEVILLIRMQELDHLINKRVTREESMILVVRFHFQLVLLQIVCLPLFGLLEGYVGSLGDKPRVEIKGRFSVTSENVDLAKVQEIPVVKISPKPQEVRTQVSTMKRSASVGAWPVKAKSMSNSHHRKEFRDSSVSASILIPHLENLVQQTTFQQDIITNLMSNLQQNEKPNGPQTRVQTMVGDTGVETGSAEREWKLLAKVFELQSRMISLTDELIASKLKHVQLQEELNTHYCQEETGDTGEDDSGEA
uniref:Uncharacterized protein n=1 Tax=Aegilops tauschii subsp. strangulata TaxID=200361 RepID=A0A453JDM8_AEGTS